MPTILRTRNLRLHGEVVDGGRPGNPKPIMRFNTADDKSLREIRATVYHEMVHQYIDYFLGIEDNAHHGDIFWLVYYTFANATFDWERPGDYDE